MDECSVQDGCCPEERGADVRRREEDQCAAAGQGRTIQGHQPHHLVSMYVWPQRPSEIGAAYRTAD
eukprot:scaffold321407_cov56-Prasinocladus_malaysianus.AAC.1